MTAPLAQAKAVRLTELDHGLPTTNTLLLHSHHHPGMAARLAVLPGVITTDGRTAPALLTAPDEAAPGDTTPDTTTSAEEESAGVEDHASGPARTVFAELTVTLDLDAVAWLVDIRRRGAHLRVETWTPIAGLSEHLDPPVWAHHHLGHLDPENLYLAVTGRLHPAPLPDADDPGRVGRVTSDQYAAARHTTTAPPLPDEATR